MWGDNSGFLNSGMAFGRGGGGGGDGSAGSADLAGGGIVTYNNEQVGSPMAGGAADVYVPAPSSGGGLVTIGGLPPPNQVAGGVITIPALDLPVENALEEPSLSPEVEQPSSENQPEPETQREFVSVEGAGPILGLADSDSAGEIIAVGPISNATGIDQADQPASSESRSAARDTIWNARRIAQVSLIGVAVLAAVLALVLRRRS